MSKTPGKPSSGEAPPEAEKKTIYRSRPIVKDKLDRAVKEVVEDSTNGKRDDARLLACNAFDLLYQETVPRRVRLALAYVQKNCAPKFGTPFYHMDSISVGGRQYMKLMAVYWMPDYCRHDTQKRDQFLALGPTRDEFHKHYYRWLELEEEARRLCKTGFDQIAHLRSTGQLEKAWPEVHARYQKVCPDYGVTNAATLAVAPKAREELANYPDGKAPQPRMGSILRADPRAMAAAAEVRK